MKLIGIVARAYYNKDNQKIMQLNEAIRLALSKYDDVVSLLLLPTNNQFYVDLKMGEDKLEKGDLTKLDYILDKCDGFIIPGGSSWYSFDEYVIKHAIQNNKPLLGICAGFQAICSMFAVNRTKFDMTSRFSDDNHYGAPQEYIHENSILKNTLLMDIVKKDSIMVNSLHHDYIDFEMKDLTISSISKDGIIEAVELSSHPFFLGLQWHPEYLMDNVSIKIFDKFIDKLKEP